MNEISLPGIFNAKVQTILALLIPIRFSERQEHVIYEQLLKLSPGLEKRLCNSSEQDIFYVAELVSADLTGLS